MDMDIIKEIPDGKPVRIFLPITESDERYRAHCIFKESESPKFSLHFKTGELPHKDIDEKESCIINIDMGGQNISLEAMITEVSNPQTLLMVAQKTINHEQMRDFFRVDATTEVISKSFYPKVRSDEGDDWSFDGTTIDISGSGLLASFIEPPPMDKQVKLEISLPNEEKDTIKVLAHPIRTQKRSDNQYDVAYHFDEIEMEDRDLIIGCCLIIQRQLLRMKVQIK